MPATTKSDIIKPTASGGSLILQGDSGGSGVSGPSIDSNGDIDFTQNTNAKIKLPSAGGIYEADGSTAVLTESGGVAQVSVGSGGTGQTSWTQGDILYSNGSNTLAKLGAGTSGQFLKTQGSGANPVWATPGGGGDFVFISKATASSTASIEFTSGLDATYKNYVFIFNNILPSEDDVIFYGSASTDGGSSYDTAANYITSYNYSYYNTVTSNHTYGESKNYLLYLFLFFIDFR